MEYVKPSKEDIQWLSYQWGNEYYAFRLFPAIMGLRHPPHRGSESIYTTSKQPNRLLQQKGTPTQAGVNSPYRDRPIEEKPGTLQEDEQR